MTLGGRRQHCENGRVERHDDDARRWAPPDRAAAPGDGSGRDAGQPGSARADAEQPHASAASPWTREVRRPAEGVRASATPASELRPPEVPWVQPPESAAPEERQQSMLPIALGLAALAGLAWVPHWVAPTISIMVALVGMPIAWGFRRISHGRRRVQFIVVTLTLVLIAAMSVIAPMTWLELGVLEPLTLPT